MKNSYRGDRPDRGNGGKKFGGKRFGGGGFGGGRGFDRRDGGRSEMFDATCAECGKDCQVPFRPSGGRPVYCSDCFGKRGDGDSRRPERSGGFEKRSGFGGGFGGDRGPRKDKRDHGGHGSQQGVPLAEINYMKKQIATANAKLDALMQALIPSGSAALPEEKAAQEAMSFDDVMPEEEVVPKEKKAKRTKKASKKKAKKK